jgi:hypothetical protein
MKLAGVAAILCFIGSSALGFYAMFLRLKIVEAVNRAQSGERPIEFQGFSLDKRKTDWYLLPAYRRLCPSGILNRKYWMAIAASIVCFVGFIGFIFQAAN